MPKHISSIWLWETSMFNLFVYAVNGSLTSHFYPLSTRFQVSPGIRQPRRKSSRRRLSIWVEFSFLGRTIHHDFDGGIPWIITIPITLYIYIYIYIYIYMYTIYIYMYTIYIYVRSTPRPVTADKWFSFNLPFQNEHKEIAPKISARRCQKKTSTCPPNPWYRIQNSRQGLHFQDLSSISVAFQHWEKKSADYRHYIHVLPWEGASKAFASKQGLEHIVKELGRLMQLAQCTIMCWSMESDWPCGKIAMFL